MGLFSPSRPGKWMAISLLRTCWFFEEHEGHSIIGRIVYSTFPSRLFKSVGDLVAVFLSY